MLFHTKPRVVLTYLVNGCRLMQICRIQCWSLFRLDRKYPSWVNLVQKFKRVNLRKTECGIVYNLLINYLHLVIQKQLLTSVLWKNCSRSSCSQMFLEIGVLKSFAIFTGKHLCWSLLINLQWILQNFYKHLFTEHLHWLLLLF